MPMRTPTLRSVVALIALAATGWFAQLPPAAPTAASFTAADLLAGSSGQPGDPDAG